MSRKTRGERFSEKAKRAFLEAHSVRKCASVIFA